MTSLAVIKKSRCFPQRCGNFLCAKVCPVNRQGKDCIIEGADQKAQISEELCIGCGICTKRCPFHAITIINLPETLKESPVHRYGRNAFELFRLPIPQKGQVVGLLGANAIGKTTALEILASLLKPNLGNYEKAPTQKEVVAHFKGTELQGYLEDLFSKDLKISYKPQYVDKIPKQVKGKVRKLLEKQASKDKVTEMAEKLDLTRILDQNINELSGGELQKVAIATALLKDADLYLIDEPASFLDIKERVRVAKVLHDLIRDNPKKMAIVVEHDLIILDYLTDQVHIIYGKTAAYGIVSHPMSSKNGINTYLAGFLRDENVRFRDEAIKFDTAAAGKTEEQYEAARWPKLSKKLGTFSLKVEPSAINAKEIVGIVGPNAIGKTTFMKLLAGVEKPDTGKVEKKLKISYKPQYLKSDSDKTVFEVLSEITKDVTAQEYKHTILKPLQLEYVMDKKVSELSGGELQRTAIAACLSRDADVYLFDEPSTYLDVEQRLQVAKAIEKIIKTTKEATALIIDHDLLFLSYLSNRLLVFSGTPGKTGNAGEIQSVKEGLNKFVQELGITMRKDPETHRPRVNKPRSVKDREQRKVKKFYLSA